MTQAIYRWLPGTSIAGRYLHYACSGLFLLLSGCVMPRSMEPRASTAPYFVHSYADLVFFSANSTDITAARAEKLLADSRKQERSGAICAEVTGFAGAADRESQRLSVLRAEAVAAILDKMSPPVPSSFDGLGAKNPISKPQWKGYDPSLNQRVQIIWSARQYAAECLRLATPAQPRSRNPAP